MTARRALAALFIALSGAMVSFRPVSTALNSLGDPGPQLLPRLTGAAMALLAVALFFRSAGETGADTEETEPPARIVLSLLAIPGFYLAFQFLGYTAAAAAYLFIAYGLLGDRGRADWLRYFLAAAAVSLASGLILERLLELPLPGVWP